jgi:hypothetical protein
VNKLDPLKRQLEEASASVVAAVPSPKISRIAWGEMEVDGLGKDKDFKLWPGGGRPWDWNETGTRHDPSIQPADVRELLDRGSTVVVLSRGQELQLQTSPGTLDLLRERGVTVHTEETRAAVKLYNDLADEGVPVGGLFHSTC